MAFRLHVLRAVHKEKKLTCKKSDTPRAPPPPPPAAPPGSQLFFFSEKGRRGITNF